MFIRFSLFIVLIGFVLDGIAQKPFTQKGMASYYGDEFQGRKTASGETYNKNAFTAAHKTLPYGTKVKVTNLKNKKSIIVVINDRGPFIKGRIIDLSRAAAQDIDLVRLGVAKVVITTITTGGDDHDSDDGTSLSTGVYNEEFKRVKPEGYGVQIGSYTEISNMKEKLLESKKKYDAPVYVQSLKQKGKQKFRIIVGNYTSKTQADKAKSTFKKNGIRDCFVVKYSNL